MTPYDLVKQAIQNKQCVTIYYNGYLRKMAPHVLGEKKGISRALFYQYGGESSSGLSEDPKDNWRCILINKIEKISLNNDIFQTASNHSTTQHCVEIIDIEINY